MNGLTLQRILLVEDSEDIQKIVEMSLSSFMGWDVKICGSGKQAVLEAVDFDPDLILLDMMMPGMDGMATLKALRAIPKMIFTPVIVMTAKAQTLEVEHYRRMGAIDVIQKPFDPILLPKTIHAMWDLHQVHLAYMKSRVQDNPS